MDSQEATIRLFSRNANLQLLTLKIVVWVLSLLNLFLCNCYCIITKFIIAYSIKNFIC